MSPTFQARRGERLARLHRIEHLLYQNRGGGITLERMAKECEVSTRQIRRDLNDLEEITRIPLEHEDGRWRVMEDYYLPPVSFSSSEALYLFMAVRLLLDHSHRREPSLVSIFQKLNSVVQPPLRDEIGKTLAWIQKQPCCDQYLETMRVLAEAWMAHKSVRIKYRGLSEDEKERLIDPYYLQPAAAGHTSYLFAYCHQVKAQRVFKIERITAIKATDKPYAIPAGFDADAYLNSTWGIITGEKARDIRLRIAPEAVPWITETIWHPTQKLEPQKDGSYIMTVRLSDTTEFLPWVLGWRDYVEVLEPPVLRREVAAAAQRTAAIYKKARF